MGPAERESPAGLCVRHSWSWDTGWFLDQEGGELAEPRADKAGYHRMLGSGSRRVLDQVNPNSSILINLFAKLCPPTMGAGELEEFLRVEARVWVCLSRQHESSD